MEFFTEYWFLWLCLALVGLLLYVLFRPSDWVEKEFEVPWHPTPNENYTLLTVDDESVNYHFANALNQYPSSWRLKMNRYGRKMAEARVERVMFVNGTYAGFDPIDLINLIKLLFPKLPKTIEDGFRRLSLSGLNKLVKDCGNFLDEYVELFASATGISASENFKWSSANHHAARLEGAVDLCKRLAELIAERRLSSDARVLLIGHSHAGQVFSIMTQLLDNRRREKLISVAAEVFIQRKELEKVLDTIREIKFDFVTLGMPPRYAWALDSRMKLLNFINHRGNSHKAGTIRGLFHTVDGDYVQQAGIRGTDNSALVPKLRMANQKLNDILDGGPNFKRWLSDMKLKNRIPKYGYTYLVDYKDRAIGVPNLLRTIFGHGAYTEYRFMEFNTRVIVDHLYR